MLEAAGAFRAKAQFKRAPRRIGPLSLRLRFRDCNHAHALPRQEGRSSRQGCAGRCFDCFADRVKGEVKKTCHVEPQAPKDST